MLVKTKWRSDVLDKYRNVCSGCGCPHYLEVSLIVPESAGGKYELDNGIVLCRTCEVVRHAVEYGKYRNKGRRPISIWVSRALSESLRVCLESRDGFKSIGSLVRYMICCVVDSPGRFSDLANYQDKGSEVKLNIWVDNTVYESFKKIVSDMGLTVTDAIKGLILLYQNEIVPNIGG